MKYMSIVMSENMGEYLYNRKCEIEILNSNLAMLEKGILNQFLITGLKGVGKTSLLKKVLND